MANGWDTIGKAQPLARLGYSWGKKCRIAGVLNAVDGSVIYVHGAKIGVKELEKFYGQIRRQYPYARKIYLIMDNWPVHYHPKVVKAAENNNIQFIPLPTYAPWTNPIEKLWRWSYQDVLHLHRYAGDWKSLIRKVCTFLDMFQNGSQELLRYVGLSEGRIPASSAYWKVPIEHRGAISELCDDIHHNLSGHDKLPI